MHVFKGNKEYCRNNATQRVSCLVVNNCLKKYYISFVTFSTKYIENFVVFNQINENIPSSKTIRINECLKKEIISMIICTLLALKRWKKQIPI